MSWKGGPNLAQELCKSGACLTRVEKVRGRGLGWANELEAGLDPGQ